MYEILHVYKTYYPDTEGGVEKVIKTIASLTRADGFHHSLLTLSPDPESEYIKFDGVDVYRAKILFSAMSCPIGGVKSIQLARRLIAKSDLVLWHYPWPFGDLINILSLKKPSIILYHSDIIKQKHIAWFYEPLRRLVFSQAACIVATSPQYSDSSPILSLLPRSKLRIIPLAVDEERNEPDTQLLAKLDLINVQYVLFVGALRYYKGLYSLIKAASSIPAKVVIAGTGKEEARLKQMAKESHASNVIFVGKVTNSQKVALLQNADVFAFPSSQRSEAFGLALAEAAMFGVPMVSCSIGTGTSYVNQNNKTGFEVPPENPDSLAQAICRILNNSDLRMQFGQQAKLHWQTELSPERFHRSWSNLFAEIISKSKFL